MSSQPLPLPPLLPLAAPPFAKALPHRQAPAQTVGLVAAGTLALWILCLVVGVLGLWLRYPTSRLPTPETPVVAKLIHVDLSENSSPADADAGTAASDPPPPEKIETPPPVIPAPAAPPDAPPLLAVAEPNPAIAFAVPVEGPSRVVDAKQAAPAPRQPAAAPAQNSVAAVHHLTFGRGEGAQPAPEYPREAVIARQTGVVSVRFNVGENGKVTSAEIVSSCRWPMLNQAALRVIRDQWHFVPGPPRLYEISIHFQLQEQQNQ